MGSFTIYDRRPFSFPGLGLGTFTSFIFQKRPGRCERAAPTCADLRPRRFQFPFPGLVLTSLTIYDLRVGRNAKDFYDEKHDISRKGATTVAPKPRH